jgi:hypothetical protein
MYLVDRDVEGMATKVQTEVRRVEVDEPALSGHDYADAFEITWDDADAERPQLWVSRGMSGLPGWVRPVVRRIGVREWTIVESTDEVVRQEQRLPMMIVTVIGRNRPGRRRMTTSLTYLRPVLGRLVWAAIGPQHRRMAKRVIGSRPSDGPVSTRGERP